MAGTKAAEPHILADSNDPKGFYQKIRAVYGLRVTSPEQLLVLDNKTIIIEMHKRFTRCHIAH